MPAGMGLNPSGAMGLAACTDAQFKKGERVDDNECPGGFRDRQREVDLAVASRNRSYGEVYVGEQKSSDPDIGRRVPDPARSEERWTQGIVARLVGNVEAPTRRPVS